MITLKGKLSTSHEGLMIGNGDLGALVFGDKFLSISLDKINLWDKRLPNEFKDKNFNYQYMVDCFKNDYKEALRLFDNCYNHSFPTKINGGLLKTDITVSDSDTSIIDYENGIIKYFTKDNEISSYVDANKNVIVVDFKHLPKFDIDMPAYFFKSVDDGGLGYKPTTKKKDGNFYIIEQETYHNNRFFVVVFIDNNSLYISITKSLVSNTKKSLLSYKENRDKHFNKHLNSYKKYFSESSVNTPDEKLNDQYNLGKYYFFANSNKKYPMTLHGVWTNCDGNLPKWKADLHNDFNVQMTYESYLKCGNFKQGKVLLNYLLEHQNTFKRNAKNFLKTDGIFIPGVMSQDGYPLGGWPQYALNPCNQIWLIKAFDEYFDYTNDIDFLKNSIYPFYKEVEVSFSKLLHINDEGYLELDFHSSPEFYEDDKKSLLDSQSNYEITCIRFLYDRLVKYSKLLKKNCEYYKKQLLKVAPQILDSDGNSMISKEVSFDHSHRHFSHILEYKNMKLVDTFDNKKQIEKDIRNIESKNTSKWVGFTYVEDAGLNAIINDGNKAYEALRIFYSNFVHNNGFHMNNDFKEYKYSQMDCYVMTLEANIGAVTSLNDMLIKNFDKKIELFPAIPDIFNGKTVSFKDLRLIGGHKISATKNGSISFKIEMKKQDELLILNTFENNPTIIVDGIKVKFNSRLGEFIEINANKNIRFN